MFRKLLRHKQQLRDSECIEILKSEPRGVLSVIDDEGYPYGLPIDHWYCEENGKLYFHCGKQIHEA
jgi:nitroimidazol reductase NimA-like FMN-containing flavoprotein (pyridoxamine 5'-phosphate oxidase superfamily)